VLVLALVPMWGCPHPNPAYDQPTASVALTDGSSGSSGVFGETTGPAEVTTSGAAETVAGTICQADADCADGVFCNGVEVCDPDGVGADLAGCVAGAAACEPGLMCQEDAGQCLGTCAVDGDGDDDGVDGVACGGDDCDDDDAAIFPGQLEVCDAEGVDEDCDPATLGGLDGDGDGLISDQCCNLGMDGLVCGDDCDDSVAGIGVGDWAHCGACGTSCGVREACLAGACVGARRVFATSTTYKADLGGLGGADGKCQGRADAAQLGGTFKAYMVDDDTDLSRLEHPKVPLVRLDGVQVADNWDDLDANVDATWDRDEFGQIADSNAWTGIHDQQGGGIASCENWTYAAGGCLDEKPCGGAGELAQTDEHWDGYFVFHCDSKFRLYCVEQ